VQDVEGHLLVVERLIHRQIQAYFIHNSHRWVTRTNPGLLELAMKKGLAPLYISMF
jgi:hypothetical protein